MKKRDISLDSNIEKLENEVRLYHDLDALIKSYQDVGGLSEKDIISVIERIKYQILLDAMSSQAGIKNKLDNFTRKWNLFSRQTKETDTLKIVDPKPDGEVETVEAEDIKTKDSDDLKKKKKRFQLRAKKKESDKFLNRMKRKLKISRCENCGYFYVHDAEKEVFQCTFFEFSSQVNKKDVCENWTDSKKFQRPFF